MLCRVGPLVDDRVCLCLLCRAGPFGDARARLAFCAEWDLLATLGLPALGPRVRATQFSAFHLKRLPSRLTANVPNRVCVASGPMAVSP